MTAKLAGVIVRVNDERALAYKKLRAAAYNLINKARPLNHGGFKVTPSLLRTLNRALDEADLLEGEEHEGAPSESDA